MDETKKKKLQQFMSDHLMRDAVYSVLLNTFLKPRSKDVHTLAAGMLAVNFLDEGWRDLSNYQQLPATSSPPLNIGL